MRKLLLALFLLMLPSMAWAQCNGQFPTATVCGNVSGSSAAPTAVPTSNFLTPVTTQTVNYTLQPSDCNTTINIGTGSTGFLTITIPPNSISFPGTCNMRVVNGDTGRGKRISGAGAPANLPTILWPGQSFTISSLNGSSWIATQLPGRWKLQGGALSVFTDPSVGSDTNDCLAPGSGNACGTWNGVLSLILNAFDCNGLAAAQTQISVFQADNTTDSTGIHYSPHGGACPGAQGGQALQIHGATRAVTSAGGGGGSNVTLTVASTTNFNVGDVKRVQGCTTGALNAQWQIVNIASNVITLGNSTGISSPSCSAGTITGVSIVSTSGIDGASFYFGSVVELVDITLRSNQNALNLLWGSKVYLSNVTLGGGGVNPIGAQFTMGNASHAECFDSSGIIIAGSAAIGLQVGTGGTMSLTNCAVNIAGNSATWNFSTAFMLAAGSGATAAFSGTPINLNGNTITGPRFNITKEAGVATNTGADTAQTYFPGNAAGLLASFASYDGNYTQIQGTATNDNAAAGNVGEYTFQNVSPGSAVSLTSNSPANIGSVSLTAGDWDVSAVAGFQGGATTTVTYMTCIMSFTSASSAQIDATAVVTHAGNNFAIFGTVSNVQVPCGPTRVSVASTTSVFLNVLSGFGTSTETGYGMIRARRVR